jgi:hypothetical protein
LDQFSYLSVLLSIVLGLGVTNLLAGFARVIQLRSRVVFYAPVLMWALSLLLMHVQTWWMMFGMQERREWTFGAFMLVLIQPVLLFFLAALIWPDFDRDEALDLKRNYFAQARWFFGFLIAIVVFSLIRNWVFMGRLQHPLDLAFHLLLIVSSVGGMVFTSELYHRFTAAMTVALMIAYIALLFPALR